MAATYGYNANAITLQYGGRLIEGGFADGEFLRIVPQTDDTQDVAGTGGDVAVSPSNDKRHTITITLLQTADANDVLNAIRIAGQATPLGLAVAPLYVADRLGRGIWESPAAWIQRPPDVVFSRGVEGRAWTLRAGILRRVDGGNVRLD